MPAVAATGTAVAAGGATTLGVAGVLTALGTAAITVLGGKAPEIIGSVGETAQNFLGNRNQQQTQTLNPGVIVSIIGGVAIVGAIVISSLNSSKRKSR